MNTSLSKITLAGLLLLASLQPTPAKAGGAFDMKLEALACLAAWGALQSFGAGWFVNAPKNKKNACIAASPTLVALTIVAGADVYERFK